MTSKANEKNPWMLSASQVLDQQGVKLDRGLENSEVKLRRKRFGFNRLHASNPKSTWVILLQQLNSVVIWILIISAVISLVIGQIFKQIKLSDKGGRVK